MLSSEKISTAKVKVVSPWRIQEEALVQVLSSSLAFIELEVENLLVVAEDGTVEVEMLNIEFENVTIEQGTEIAIGELMEKKPKISVRKDLKAIRSNDEDEVGDLLEDDSALLEEVSDNLLVTKLGF